MLRTLALLGILAVVMATLAKHAVAQSPLDAFTPKQTSSPSQVTPPETQPAEPDQPETHRVLLIRTSVISIGLIAGALTLYLLLRHRIFSAQAEPITKQTRRRLLKLSLLLAVCLILVRLWSDVAMIVIPGLEEDLAKNQIDKWILTVGVGLIIYVLVKSARRSLMRSELDLESRHKIRMMTNWLGLFVFFVSVLIIWAASLKNAGVFFGIVGAGLALSLQETLLCIAGWILLVSRRPYDIGDRIEIDNRKGDVIGYNLFQTTMLEVGNWVQAEQSTGRMLILPNSMLFRHTVYNYTKGFPFLWNEVATVVTFESNWELASELMLEIARKEDQKFDKEVERYIQQMQGRYAIRYGHLEPTIYTNIADQGVQLTLRFLSPVRKRRATTHAISEKVLREFLAHPEIDFAYPTTRIFRNNEEGKPATGGPKDKSQVHKRVHFEDARPPENKPPQR